MSWNGYDLPNNVTAIQFDPMKFGDWDAMFEKYMARPSPVKVNHIFTARDDNPTIMYKQKYDGYTETAQVIIKREYVSTDWYKNVQVLPLVAPGIQDIKWMELYNKWRKLVPSDRHNKWFYFCNPPSKATEDRVRQHTKASKKQRTDRSRTIDKQNTN